MTQILDAQTPAALTQAITLLRRGQVVAIPTDTVYGVAALALDAAAVAKIFAAKERPADKPLPVFVPSVAELTQVCRDVPPVAYSLLKQHWPGALTVVLPAAPAIPGIVTHNGPSIAVRIPDYPLVLQLLHQLQEPLAVTSANRSGGPNAQTAAEVKRQLDGRIALILDDGPSPSRVASTIVDFTQSPPKILRQGGVVIPESVLGLGGVEE